MSLRLFTGILGIYTTFLLVMRSNEAVDLLLNFSAMGFVAELDGIAFALALAGFFGPAVKRKAEEVDQYKVTKTSASDFPCCQKMDSKFKRRWLRVMPYLVVATMLVLGAIMVAMKQNERNFEDNLVYVQFSDEIWSKLPLNSGIYEGRVIRVKTRGDVGQIKYVKLGTTDTKNSPGFVYCRRDGGSWMFDDLNDTHRPCDNLKIRSNMEAEDATPSDEFNLLSHASAPWIYNNPRSTATIDITINSVSDLEVYESIANTSCDVLSLEFWEKDQRVAYRYSLVSSRDDNDDTGRTAWVRLAERPFYRAQSEDSFSYIYFNGYRWIITKSMTEQYNTTRQVMKEIGPDEINLISDGYPFLTIQDTYFPAESGWYGNIGFLPDPDRSTDAVSVSCIANCTSGPLMVVGLGTDGWPFETFFTIFQDSFFQSRSAEDTLIPFKASAVFDFKESSAFRGGPFPKAGVRYFLNGCVDNDEKFKVGLYDSHGDGLWLSDRTGNFTEESDPCSIPGEFWILFHPPGGLDSPFEVLFTLVASVDFKCVVFDVDVAKKNATAHPCNTTEQKFMEDTLTQY